MITSDSRTSRTRPLLLLALTAPLLVACDPTQPGGGSGGGSGGSDTTDGVGGSSPSGGAGGTVGSGGVVNLGGAASGGAPTTGLCPRLVGDVTVATQADVDALSAICSIDGDLIVSVSGISSIHLTELETVTGRVNVQSNPELTELDLPALVTLGSLLGEDDAALVVAQNDQLLRIALPSLTEVGWINIPSSPALTELDLSSLVAARSLDVAGTALTVLDLPALTEGDIGLDENAELEALEVPAWTSGSLTVLDCDSLTALSCPSLTSSGGINLEQNDVLASLDVPLLESMDGWLAVRNHPLLGQLSFPALTKATWVELSYNDALLSVSCPVLETITQNRLEIFYNLVLLELHFPVLVLGQLATIFSNPVLEICEGEAVADGAECE